MSSNSTVAALYARFFPRGGKPHPDNTDYAVSNGFIERAKRTTGEEEDVYGVDSDNRFLLGNRMATKSFTPVSITLPSNGLIGAAQTIYIARRKTVIKSVAEVHATAGNAGGSVTFTVTRERGTTASGSGNAVLSGTLDLKGTANTVQNGTLVDTFVHSKSSTKSFIVLERGDRLSIKTTGTLTTLAGLNVTLFLAPGYADPCAVYSIGPNGSIADQCFFLANLDRTVKEIAVVWGTAGSDAGAVTLQVHKDTSTDAPGAGSATLLNAALSLKTTAATVAFPALTGTAASKKLAAGDRLAANFTGTLTALANVCIVVFFEPDYTDQFEVTYYAGANAQHLDSPFFIADRPYEVVDVSEVHGTAGGASSTLAVRKCTGTQAPASGALVTTAGFAADGTANTVQVGTLNASRRNLVLYPGDRLAADYNGTLGSIANAVITAVLRPV